MTLFKPLRLSKQEYYQTKESEITKLRNVKRVFTASTVSQKSKLLETTDDTKTLLSWEETRYKLIYTMKILESMVCNKHLEIIHYWHWQVWVILENMKTI